METEVKRRTIAIVLTFCLSGPAHSIDLLANRAVDCVGICHDYTTAAGKEGNWEQTEWWDSWFSDGGCLWYTPEDYWFDSGDTLGFVVFIHLEGSTANFLRADAFYLCGTTNPLSFVMTSGRIDFGPRPENTPGYGWVTGIGYLVPPLPSVSFDAASRVDWNGTIDCGVPLSGRPDCGFIN